MLSGAFPLGSHGECASCRICLGTAPLQPKRYLIKDKEKEPEGKGGKQNETQPRIKRDLIIIKEWDLSQRKQDK